MRMLNAFFCLVVGGCATTPPLGFSHATATQQVFMQDRYACLKEAQQSRMAGYADQYGGSIDGTVITNRRLFISCMAAKGYSVGGPLVTPPEAKVRTVN